MTNRRKILIVDDHSDLRMLLVTTLIDLDADIHEASDGAEAIAKAKTLRPELILMDVMMPGGIDGTQACEVIKSDPDLKDYTKVIFISARGQTYDKEIARRAGGDAYIVKPYSPMELVDVVEEILERFPASEKQ